MINRIDKINYFSYNFPVDLYKNDTTPQTVACNGSGSAATAVPDACYHFVNWSDSSTDNPRTDINVTNNVTVTANFAISPNTVYFQSIGNQTVGSNFSIQVMIYDASYLAYATFDIRYNASILSFQSLPNSSR